LREIYSNVKVHHGKICYRGARNGQSFSERINYKPTLYVPDTDATAGIQDLKGNKLRPIDFKSVKAARDFINNYRDVPNYTVYGNSRFEYAYISEKFPQSKIEWNIDDLYIANIDLEVGSEHGFPNIEKASDPLLSISIESQGRYTVFGYGDYQPQDRSDIAFIKCDNEEDLVTKFMTWWTNDYPDIITGWNVRLFDVTYLVNRIKVLRGEAYANLLSPWGYIGFRRFKVMGREQTAYDLSGINILDYMDLFKKFSPKAAQESYTLDHIAHVLLGERKLSYSEHQNLHSLYKQDYQKFIDYNVRDTELIKKIEAKEKLLVLALTLAYNAKVNPEDVFSQVRMWTQITDDFLAREKIYCPVGQGDGEKDTEYEGAFVKEPKPGEYHWIASFDLTSMYPHLIMQFNISPETIVDKQFLSQHLGDVNVDSLLDKKVDTSALKKWNYALTPNGGGQYFRRDIHGFLPRIMETMFTERKFYKDLALETEAKLEVATDDQEKSRLQNELARCNNLQSTLKICLNSAYGALGNQFFKHYDVRQAEAVTQSGQLAIMWIERVLNKYLNDLLKTEADYVIASDTDSVYLNLKPLVEMIKAGKELPSEKIVKLIDKICKEKLTPVIDQAYQELADYTNAYSQKMLMKREVICDKGIWIAKKNYILNVHSSETVFYDKPKIKMKGISAVRSSTPQVCRDKIKKALELIMEKTENDVINFIRDFKKEWKTLSVEDIASPRSVNGLTKYKGTRTLYQEGAPIHVKGSLLYNKLLAEKKLTNQYQLIKEGEKIKYVYLKQPNPWGENTIAFPSVLPKEFNIQDLIDYNFQFTKAFVDQLKIILDAIGWKTERSNTLKTLIAKNSGLHS
jgi:DNA polymerase elongation subunit (family B)